MEKEELERLKKMVKKTMIPITLHQLFIVLPELILGHLYECFVVPIRVFTNEEYLDQKVNELYKELNNEKK